jgi:hypothetical protein
MQVFKRAALSVLPILAAGAVFLAAQEPTVSGTATARASGASAAAIAGSKEDPAAVERGETLCHLRRLPRPTGEAVWGPRPGSFDPGVG